MPLGLSVGVDIGGSKLLAVRLGAAGEIEAFDKLPTPPDAEAEMSSPSSLPLPPPSAQMPAALPPCRSAWAVLAWSTARGWLTSARTSMLRRG